MISAGKQIHETELRINLSACEVLSHEYLNVWLQILQTHTDRVMMTNFEAQNSKHKYRQAFQNLWASSSRLNALLLG